MIRPMIIPFGDKTKALMLSGQARNLFATVLDEAKRSGLSSLNRTFYDRESGAAIQIDIQTGVYGKSGYAMITVPVGVSVSNELGGAFLYYPRNAIGNYFASITGINPQRNILSPNKITANTTLKSNEVYWTNGTKLDANRLREGVDFCTPGDYSFENNSHYFSVFDNGSNQLKVNVFNFNGSLLQTLTLPHFISARIIQANKSATELLVVGGLAEQALPFSYSPRADGAFLTRMQKKWEGIGRYAVEETGIPATPYQLTEVAYKTQWRGWFLENSEDVTRTVLEEFVGMNIDKIGYESAFSSLLKYNSAVVLVAYYDSSEAYQEIVFNGGTVAETTDNQRIVCETHPGSPTGQRSIISQETNATFRWDFTLGGRTYFYEFSSQYSIDADTNALTNNYATNASLRLLDSFNPYSKIQPYWSVSATDEFTYSGVIPDVFFLYSPKRAFVYTVPAGNYYFNRAVIDNTGMINFPAKSHSTLPTSRNFYVDMVRLIDGSISGAGMIGSGVERELYSTSTLIKQYMWIDPVVFFKKAVTRIFTDRKNNHLVVWNNTPDYKPAFFAATKGIIANKTLDKSMNISTKIEYPFYMADFIGPV